MTQEKKEPDFLTKDAFEKLLTKAAQPIRKQPAQEAEQTSESHRSDD
jgi:hypothetical protein